MIDAYELYQDTLDVVNKEEAGLLNVNLFNRIANAHSLTLFKKLKSELEDPATAQSLGQINRDLLFPFTQSVTGVALRGVFPRPSDYEMFSAMRAAFDDGRSIITMGHLDSLICSALDDPTINVDEITSQKQEILSSGWVEVQLLTHERIARRLSSHIPGKRPHPGKPVAEQVAGAFQVYPAGDASIRMIYYRRPLAGKLSMVIDPLINDEVYNLAGSLPWEWPQTAKGMLVGMIAQYFSVYIREKDLYQMSDNLNQQK